MPTTKQQLIGSAEAAKIRGCSQRTIHRLVQDGKLTPAMIAPGGFKGAYLFNREDVEQLEVKDTAA